MSCLGAWETKLPEVTKFPLQWKFHFLTRCKWKGDRWSVQAQDKQAWIQSSRRDPNTTKGPRCTESLHGECYFFLPLSKNVLQHSLEMSFYMDLQMQVVLPVGWHPPWGMASLLHALCPNPPPSLWFLTMAVSVIYPVKWDSGLGGSSF